jgi:hypothetical protein
VAPNKTANKEIILPKAWVGFIAILMPRKIKTRIKIIKENNGKTLSI